MADDRLHLLTIVGTRPEIIKLSRVIAEADVRFRHTLAHTGQNYDYELSQIFFEQLGIRRPDVMLEAARGGAAETVAAVITSSDRLMAEIRPDALLILGDTNSCLAAYAAKRRRIPIFHMEAGNRCFDMRVPEEINRRIVDHLSDINLPYTEHARRYLLNEGIRPDTVIKTGSPMREVLEYHAGGIEASDVLGRMGLEPRGYFVFSAHREENVDDPERLQRLIACINGLAREHNKPVIVSVHARTRRRLDALPEGAAVFDDRVRPMTPLGFFDYVRLMRDAACTVSDSGTVCEESSIIGFPAVTIREAHERPEGMDVGAFLMCGLDAGKLLAGVEMAAGQWAAGQETKASVAPEDYAARDVSTKVTKIIASYTDYIARTTWRRTDV